MPKDQGGLGKIDVATQNNILVAKWLNRCLEGSSPWQVLMRYRLLLDPCVGKIIGKFILCDIIYGPHKFSNCGVFHHPKHLDCMEQGGMSGSLENVWK